MSWKVISTETFSKEFKKYKKNPEFVNALDKKIKRISLFCWLQIIWKSVWLLFY